MSISPDPPAAVVAYAAALDNLVQAAQVLREQYIRAVAPLLLQHGDGAPAPTVTTYNQRNPLWGAAKLGTSNTTVGGYGCLMTCAASMLTDAGAAMNPLQLNNWLKANGGFTGSNLFVFASVDKLNVVKFYNLIDCASTPAPVAQLDELVSQGDFVIVKVDFDPATIRTEEHWVRYLGNGQMMDPWQGDIAPITPRYRGKDAAQAILRAAIYKRLDTQK
jgi:hypothetical protein